MKFSFLIAFEHLFHVNFYADKMSNLIKSHAWIQKIFSEGPNTVLPMQNLYQGGNLGGEGGLDPLSPLWIRTNIIRTCSVTSSINISNFFSWSARSACSPSPHPPESVYLQHLENILSPLLSDNNFTDLKLK